MIRFHLVCVRRDGAVVERRSRGLALILLGLICMPLSGALSQEGPAAWRVECTGDGKTLECRALQQLVRK
jgi:hypothetical protein